MNQSPHKKQDYFMTNWGSCNIYSRPKVNAGKPPHKLLYIQLMGAVAEGGFKGGQTSVLCSSHISAQLNNPSSHLNHRVASFSITAFGGCKPREEVGQDEDKRRR